MEPVERPIFVVAPPQSGTLFVQRELARLSRVTELPAAGRDALDSHPGASGSGHEGNRLSAEDATPAAVDRLRARIRAALPAAGGRFVDATPRNSLRVPFLDAAFPDASFIYIYREPRATVASMIEAWESGDYVTYPQLPGWTGPPWSLLLVPGWERLAGRTLAEIASGQWAQATRVLLADLEALAPERWSVVDFEALVADADGELGRVVDFLGLADEPAPHPGDPATFVETPRPQTTTRHGEALQAALPAVIGVAERARDLLAHPVSRRPMATPDSDSPLRSSYTAGFAAALEATGGALLVSTHPSGRLVAVRYEAPRVNTHFRELPGAAGIALADDRLSIATEAEVWRYRERPEARGAVSAAECDACFVPHERRYTGEIGARELAFAADPEAGPGRADTEWIASSRFSCLATLDAEHSFVPRWRPPFVSELAGDDRCHLSGLAVADGRPAFVTVLGETDEPEGWRSGLANGGALIDVGSGETVARGLSLPHSPRWHDGRVVVLEAGAGILRAVDPGDGSGEVIAELPGFARGLAIAGATAFVGLSRLREDADAGELPVAERFDELFGGVWAVDLRSGAIRGYLRFDGALAEVFGVAFVAGSAFPEVADPQGRAARESFALPG